MKIKKEMLNGESSELLALQMAFLTQIKVGKLYRIVNSDKRKEFIIMMVYAEQTTYADHYARVNEDPTFSKIPTKKVLSPKTGMHWGLSTSYLYKNKINHLWIPNMKFLSEFEECSFG